MQLLGVLASWGTFQLRFSLSAREVWFEINSEGTWHAELKEPEWRYILYKEILTRMCEQVMATQCVAWGREGTEHRPTLLFLPLMLTFLSDKFSRPASERGL